MIKILIEQWNKNKEKLETHYKTMDKDSLDYIDIVKNVFTIVSPYANKNGFSDEWDLKKMTVIDDGDYQGTQLFIIPISTYQPSIEDYIITNTYYGSCSGCDTLEGILSQGEYDAKKFNESQIKDLMALSLHLLQKAKLLGGNDG